MKSNVFPNSCVDYVTECDSPASWNISQYSLQFPRLSKATPVLGFKLGRLKSPGTQMLTNPAFATTRSVAWIFATHSKLVSLGGLYKLISANFGNFGNRISTNNISFGVLNRVSVANLQNCESLSSSLIPTKIVYEVWGKRISQPSLIIQHVCSREIDYDLLCGND